MLVQASVIREMPLALTLTAMAPCTATKPVAAQAPATPILEMILPAAEVARSRKQAGTAWMAMAAAEAKAVRNTRRFAELAFFWTKPQHDCWHAWLH